MPAHVCRHGCKGGGDEQQCKITLCHHNLQGLQLMGGTEKCSARRRWNSACGAAAGLEVVAQERAPKRGVNQEGEVAGQRRPWMWDRHGYRLAKLSRMMDSTTGQGTQRHGSRGPLGWWQPSSPGGGQAVTVAAACSLDGRIHSPMEDWRRLLVLALPDHLAFFTSLLPNLRAGRC